MSSDPKSENPQTSSHQPEDVEAIAGRPARLPKIIRFDELSVCGDEIWIDNQGELYRLRRTKQGKLILTK
ncbi:MAG TPA: hemin uptake protein HemP [Planctomycetaceae bacterium]|nr:hemin uptake protein HemP [Planctomycetaceae bacterium]